MTAQTKLVALGVWPAEAAACAAGDFSNLVTLAATGNNTPTNAYVITADLTIFTTIGATTNSAILSNQGSAFVVVFNNSANTLNVFPPTGSSINGLAVNTSFAVAANKSTTFITPDGITWVAQHAG